MRPIDTQRNGGIAEGDKEKRAERFVLDTLSTEQMAEIRRVCSRKSVLFYNLFRSFIQKNCCIKIKKKLSDSPTVLGLQECPQGFEGSAGSETERSAFK